LNGFFKNCGMDWVNAESDRLGKGRNLDGEWKGEKRFKKKGKARGESIRRQPGEGRSDNVQANSLAQAQGGNRRESE